MERGYSDRDATGVWVRVGAARVDLANYRGDEMSDIVERLRQKERDYYQRDTGGAYGMGPVLRDAADEIERLQGLVAKGLAVVHDFLPNIGRCVLQDYQRMNEFCSEAAARTAVSAVQPERCCLDYPRCDCNSPPESEGAE